LRTSGFSKTVTIQALQVAIGSDMDAVDRIIRASLHSDVALIRTIGDYIIGGGGKRLRPALVVLCAQAFGYNGTRHYELAAVVEFIHTATLLHDDVVDESELRRGQQTANALFGNAASVLVGDFLYSRAFQMMVDVGSVRVMRVLADATNVIAEGEVLQLMNIHHADLQVERYLAVIRYKTAKLFEAAARIGAILGGASEDEENAFGRYGTHLGTAFQLIDDVLDYSGDENQTGKNLGDDLSEGKATLPLLHAMRNGTAAQAGLIRHAIEHGGLEEFGPVLTAIRETGALDYTREKARAEAKAAADAIQRFSRSSSIECLLELADFAVTRDH
jgi:octaprenyl-diphosphate synthase